MSTHRTRRGAGPAVLGVVLAGVTAVSGTAGAANGNGVESTPAKQAFTNAVQKTFGAQSFSLTGTINGSGHTVSLNETVGQNQGSGKLTLNGDTINLVLLGGTLYFQADSGFYQSQGLSQSEAAQLGGQWVSVPTTNQDFGNFASFLIPSKLQQELLKGMNSKTVRYTKSGSSNINGASVLRINVKDSTKSQNSGAVFVAEVGTPYLVRISGGSDGSLTFSNFNQPLNVKAPPAATPLSGGG